MGRRFVYDKNESLRGAPCSGFGYAFRPQAPCLELVSLRGEPNQIELDYCPPIEVVALTPRLSWVLSFEVTLLPSCTLCRA